jgi:arsenite methyltransferase
MKTIQVYDPPMCCSTGACGPDVDPVLPRFAGLLAQLGGAGVKIERYNLAQQPLAFVQNPAVKALLDQAGTDALPAIFIDGVLALKGAYPDTEQRAAWMGRARAGAAT